jgi:hypothetical protein
MLSRVAVKYMRHFIILPLHDVVARCLEAVDEAQLFVGNDYPDGRDEREKGVSIV